MASILVYYPYPRPLTRNFLDENYLLTLFSIFANMLSITYMADNDLIQPQFRKRVTIKDVAQAAGVSTQTVSRVMNRFSYVSEETRQRVEKVVEQLNYRPSAIARSLIQQRSHMLGVVTFGLQYSGPSRTLNGIADMADQLGYMLLMEELDDFEAPRAGSVIDSLLAHQVDGILWAAPEIGNNHAWIDDEMSKIPVPIMFIASQPREGIASIATDNYHGAVIATQHLFNCGRKQIAHISGPLDWWEARERQRGWRDALSTSGIEATNAQWVEGNWSSASGEQGFLQLLESFPEMDALFVGNDQMALGVLRESLRRGIQIPNQLAVVGFDNIAESAYLYPSLTTVAQDLQLLGQQAVQNIVAMIQAHQENRFTTGDPQFIQPTLVVRESSQALR
jgi:DNA-binding LacI/PurR family transcriptional regulator